MADLVVIDTDILIDAGRGIPDAVACLLALEQKSSPAISAVTQMELLVGSRSMQEQIEIEKFLSRFQILKITGNASDAAVELLKLYRLSHGLLIADALIAATARVLDASLISKNQRDYRFISGLDLLTYPQS